MSTTDATTTDPPAFDGHRRQREEAQPGPLDVRPHMRRHADRARRLLGERLQGQRPGPLQVVALVLAMILAPVAWSYGYAVTRPGTDPIGIRSTEWLRDHGGRGVVTWAENLWYDHHKPKVGGLPSASALPANASATTAAPTATADTPVPVHLLATPALAGEGEWQPLGRLGGDGEPLLYTTFMRPDAVHTSLVTGLAWMDPKRLSFSLYAGTQQPGGSGWPLQAPIATAVLPELVSAFNSGFKMSDARGGFYENGQTAAGHPLVTGQASLIFRTDGTMTVGMWGRDATLDPTVEAVRQNLILLIDNGQEAPNLDENSESRWGYTLGNATLVWRSGVGVDASGHVIYAAGNGLSVQSLANVLLAAGSVRAMELDINSEWVNFFSYTNGPNGTTVGTRLIPEMRQAPDRYFQPSERDFVAAFVRPSV